MEKLIITAAICGAEVTKAHNPAVPYTVEEMVREALLHAGEKREVRYLHGILKAWHAKGWRTVQDVRGGGALTGSNVRADRPTPSGRDIFQRAPGRVRRLKREE